MKKKLIIFGLGDNFKILENEISKKYCISLIIDKNYNQDFYNTGSKYIPVKKKLDENLINKKILILITISDIKTRSSIVRYVKKKFKKIKFPNFISSKAKLVSNPIIGEGSIIFPYSFINHNSVVGDFVIINNSCHIQHDNCVSDFVNINPKVITGGNVNIGSKVTIGINSTLKNNISIGKNSFVGMGSIISQNIPKNTMIYFKSKKIKKLFKNTN